MLHRTLALFALPLAALSLAACERRQPEPQPSEAPVVPPPAAPSPAPVPSASPSPAPDDTVLNERKDPARVLHAYADALQARDWNRAARFWGVNSGVTAAILKAAYDRAERPRLEIGKGQQEGAAGSLYYEAPVVLRFGEDQPERGTLTLRRVNDVEGATTEQLRWHIERATIGVGQ